MKKPIKTRNPKTKMTSRKTQIFSYDFYMTRGEVAVKKHKKLIIMFS